MSTEEQTPTELFQDFICVCKDDGKQQAEELMAEVRSRLAAGSEELTPVQEEYLDKYFVTAVVTSLNWDYNASITRIGNDQWSVVLAENYDQSFKTRVQCDLIEHGIAATWKAFADRKER